MGKCSIEVGTVVNGLEVLSLAYNNGRNYWNVKCTCGNIKVLSTSELNRVQGICRCPKDLRGSRVGNVLVGDYQYKYKGFDYYEVLCLDCKTIFESNNKSLYNSNRPCQCPLMDFEVLEGVATVTIHSKNKSFKVLVDEEDYHKHVKGNFWYLSAQGYAFTREGKGIESLHRKVMSADVGDVVDHISGEVYDNTKKNLRIVTSKDNNKNCSINKNNKSGYTGVIKESNGRYRASITVDYVSIHLGVFDVLEDAVRAREKAEVTYGFHKNHGRKPKPVIISN